MKHRRPKRLHETDALHGHVEELSLMDFRMAPGDAITQVQMGKVYVLTKAGKPVAVLSKPPGETLIIHIDSRGDVSYGK